MHRAVWCGVLRLDAGCGVSASGGPQVGGCWRGLVGRSGREAEAGQEASVCVSVCTRTCEHALLHLSMNANLCTNVSAVCTVCHTSGVC